MGDARTVGPVVLSVRGVQGWAGATMTDALAGIELATLYDEVRRVRNRCDDHATDNADVRCGLDLAAGWLDAMLARHGQMEDRHG